MITAAFRRLVTMVAFSGTLATVAAQAPTPSQPAAQAPQAQPPAPAPPTETDPATGQPVFRTGINFVRVDAIVTDRQGRPIDDLKPEDFEVYEDGKLQSVETFKLMRVDGNPPPGETTVREINSSYAEEAEARRDDVRLFVIFFDDYHVRLGTSLAVKEPLTRFIQTQIGPMDMVAMMYPLDPVRAVSFTRNRRGIVDAILRWEGRKYRYIPPRNMFEEQYANYPVEVVERIRNQVSLSALRGLMTRLGSLREGRKTVIVVSEGYTDYVPPQLRGPNAQSGIRGLGTSPLTGDPSVDPDRALLEDRLRFFGDADIRNQLRDVANEANRNNVSLYMLDPRGLAGFEFDIDEGVGLGGDLNQLRALTDTLRMLADETDGRAIVNQNDLGKGLEQMLRDSSAYYLLGYNSNAAPTDGKFHQVRVRVKRPGVEVRARRGYWALKPEEAAVALAPARPGPPPDVNKALAEIDRVLRARTVRTWVGYSPDPSGKTRVHFTWEPSTGAGTTAAPVSGGASGDTVSQVTVMAANETDGPVYRGKVAPGTQTSFLVTPGPAQMRVQAEGEAGGVLNSDVIEVTVPDFTTSPLTVGTPALFRARTQRDLQALAAAVDPTPSPARSFSRTEKLLLRVSVSGAPPSIRMLSRTGDGMSPLVVREAPAGSPFSHEAEVPLASLPAGDYLIEVRAGDAEDAPRVLTGIKVTG